MTEHYTQHKKIQPIEVIEDWKLNFNLGNVVKYLSRYEAKGGLDDLAKALNYLHREIYDEWYDPRAQINKEYSKLKNLEYHARRILIEARGLDERMFPWEERLAQALEPLRSIPVSNSGDQSQKQNSEGPY